MFNGQKQKLTIIFLSLSRMSSHILRGLGLGRDAFGYKTKGGGKVFECEYGGGLTIHVDYS